MNRFEELIPKVLYSMPDGEPKWKTVLLVIPRLIVWVYYMFTLTKDAMR